MDLTILQPRAELLLAAVALDVILGDPVYRLHPIRIMGATLSWFERRLRALGTYRGNVNAKARVGRERGHGNSVRTYRWSG